MIVVANADPLIALAQIGQFHLLQLLFGKKYIFHQPFNVKFFYQVREDQGPMKLLQKIGSS